MTTSRRRPMLPLRIVGAGIVCLVLAVALVATLIALAVSCGPATMHHVNTTPTPQIPNPLLLADLGPPPPVILTLARIRAGQMARLRVTLPSPSKGRPRVPATLYILPPTPDVGCGREAPRYMDDDSGDMGRAVHAPERCAP